MTRPQACSNAFTRLMLSACVDHVRTSRQRAKDPNAARGRVIQLGLASAGRRRPKAPRHLLSEAAENRSPVRLQTNIAPGDGVSAPRRVRLGRTSHFARTRQAVRSEQSAVSQSTTACFLLNAKALSRTLSGVSEARRRQTFTASAHAFLKNLGLTYARMGPPEEGPRSSFRGGRYG